jgi:cyanophycinase
VLPGEQTVTVIGLDEETALVGGPDNWTVQGRQSAWRITPEGREQYPAGTALTIS